MPVRCRRTGGLADGAAGVVPVTAGAGRPRSSRCHQTSRQGTRSAPQGLRTGQGQARAGGIFVAVAMANSRHPLEFAQVTAPASGQAVHGGIKRRLVTSQHAAGGGAGKVRVTKMSHLCAQSAPPGPAVPARAGIGSLGLGQGDVFVQRQKAPRPCWALARAKNAGPPRWHW